MCREDFLKELITKNGYTLKEFSREVNIPYSTIRSMLNEGRLNGAAVSNVLKICEKLNIKVEDLYEDDISQEKINPSKDINYSNKYDSKMTFKDSGNLQLKKNENNQKILELYNLLDLEDKAEIRGTIKQILKSTKYLPNVTKNTNIDSNNKKSDQSNIELLAAHSDDYTKITKADIEKVKGIGSKKHL